MSTATLTQLKACINDGLASQLVADAVEDFAADKLVEMKKRPEAYREAFSGLLECLPESTEVLNDDAAQMVCTAMMTLFGLAASQSGTAVSVRKPAIAGAGGGPTFGVLILGFGGSSMLQLEQIEKVYKGLRPSWTTVAAIQTALSGARVARLVEQQVREVSEALSGIDHVIVHAMSNNGYALWMRLQKADPALAAKVCGCVFDCGIMLGNSLGESEWYNGTCRRAPTRHPAAHASAPLPSPRTHSP